MEYRHTPVMLKEVLLYLKPGPGENYIDATFGGGGYTAEIIRNIRPNGKVMAFDLDHKAIEHGKIKFKNSKNLIFINDNFKNLSKYVKRVCPEPKTRCFSGVVFDLGLSQAQLEDRSRGFSFMLDAPLDMAFGQLTADDRRPTTEYIINTFKRDSLQKILKQYSEERYAGKIADEIIRERKVKKINTTGELVRIIGNSVPAQYKNKKIHFATKTFQALRIATNRELENLEEALVEAVDLLKKGGRIAVVSYHSLEDRIVKNFFREESKNCICKPEIPICSCGHKAKIKVITKKIITPNKKEILNNPKSRSAKMRVAEKL